MCYSARDVRPGRRRGLSGFLVIVLGMAWPLVATKAEESPELEAHQREVSLVGDGVSLFTAWGGSTDAPPDDMGCPPWVKTGNRRYIWHVEGTEICEGGRIPTDPDDGAVTTEEMLIVSDSVPGSISISVSLQEEWRDSGENPRTIYWPEAPEPTP